MNRTFPCALITLLVSAPAIARTPDAPEIIDTMQQKQIERWQGIDRYTVTQTVMGNRTQLFYERVTVPNPKGKPVPRFRLVPPSEAMQRSQQMQGQRPMTPDEMRQYADAMEMTGQAVSDEVESGMKEAGLPPGLLKGMGGSEPWISPDPGTMMSGNATVMRSMADGVEQQAVTDQASAEQDAANSAAALDRARLIGIEKVDGKAAFHLRADGLNQKQMADDREFTVQSVDLWVDKKMYVPLRSKIQGVAVSATETTPMTIEQSNTDYRTVPGSKMYEPYQRVVHMTGVMDPKQQQDMEEARRKLADLDQQLAAMPPEQRQMITNQMGPQLAMIRNMASGGGFEIVTTVDEIRIGEFASLQPATAHAPGGALPIALPPAAAAPPPSPAAQDPATLHAAQQACLQRKMREAEAAKKKKHGLGSLFGAISRTVSRYGIADLSRASDEIYNANATATDVAAAAKDLGLTEDDVAACRNPS